MKLTFYFSIGNVENYAFSYFIIYMINMFFSAYKHKKNYAMGFSLLF